MYSCLFGSYSSNNIFQLRLGLASATFFSYLASPRAGTKMSGLYLHSPASEGMWMGAHFRSTPDQVSLGMGVPARFRVRFWNPQPPLPRLHAHQNTQGEKR